MDIQKEMEAYAAEQGYSDKVQWIYRPALSPLSTESIGAKYYAWGVQYDVKPALEEDYLCATAKAYVDKCYKSLEFIICPEVEQMCEHLDKINEELPTKVCPIKLSPDIIGTGDDLLLRVQFEFYYIFVEDPLTYTLPYDKIKTASITDIKEMCLLLHTVYLDLEKYHGSPATD